MPTLHPPTRGESVARSCAYALTSVIGVYTLLLPFHSGLGTDVQERLGLGIIAAVWSVFLLTSLPAAVATLVGRWRVEFVLLPLFSSALAVACVSAWVNVAMGNLPLLPRTSIATALLCLFVARVITLHRVTKVATSWTSTEPSK